jgi:hypothetical protein
MMIVCAALTLSIANAKSYQIALDHVSKAGNVTLQPGKYKVAVDSSKVRFTDVTSGKSVETDGKVVNSQKKFGNTAVNATQVDGASQIQEITLGGTNTKIEFE